MSNAAAEHDDPLSTPRLLATEFPGWEIVTRPSGLNIWTAYWCSPDGRSRRYIVARSDNELLQHLRTIGPLTAELQT